MTQPSQSPAAPRPSEPVGLREVLAVNRRTIVRTAKALAPPGAAAAGLALLAGTRSPWTQGLGVALSVLALLAIGYTKRRPLRRPRRGRLIATFVSTRVLLLVTVGVGFTVRQGPGQGAAWAGVALALVLVVSEPQLKTMLGTRREVVAGLPGVDPVPPKPFPGAWLAVAGLALIVVGGALAALAAPGWVFLVLTVAVLPLHLVLARYALMANAISKRITRQIPGALRSYAPQFAVYYAAVSGAEYQLGMWLPYLERLGRPFVVITRNPVTVPTIRKITDAPVLVPLDLAGGSLDRMVVPSLKAAFYVQGSPGNQTFQRYRQLTHIWLNHGDSDKQANFHPRHATYDRLFVSGQLGIDRYAAHGITVPPEKFDVVGRPQVERIEVAGPGAVDRAAPRVLYAPTWQGGRPSTSYSSLPVGPQIVAALLERGATVVFRPHPLSYGIPADARQVRAVQALLEADRERTGRQHVWGRQAERDWDVPACFNATQALITDVSSLASDYLASGKPFAMVAVTAHGDAFREEFRMARVAYVIEDDLSTLDTALDDLLGDDPLREQREEYRRYCLGEVTGPHAADAFVARALALIDR